MADKADGSIIIDTELDSKGFDSGSKELLAAIRSLTNEIRTLGNALKGVFDQPLNPDVKTGNAEHQVNALKERILELEAAMEEMRNQNGSISPQFSTGGVQKTSDLQRQIDSVNASVERLEPTFNRAMSGSASAMSTFEGKASELENKISELRQRLEALAQTRIPTDEYKEVSAEAEKAGQKLEKLLNKQERMQELGVNENSAQWKALQYDLEQAKQSYERLEAAKARMENNGSAYRSGADTAEYERMEAILRGAEQHLSSMRSEAAQIRNEVQRSNSAWAQMPTLSGYIKNAFAGVVNAVRTAGNAFAHPLQAADRLLGSMVQKAGAVASVIGRTALSAVKKLASGLRSAASHMAKMVFHGRDMKGQFSGLISSAKKFTLSLLGARGIYALLRKAVSAYMSENQELANTLSACWSGIGNLLGPIITRLINLVAQAVSYVTSFLKLFGVFGSSASKATGKAASAAKELKRQLASFDELNVLSDNSSDKEDGSDAASKLPEVTLPDWARQIADILKTGDWKGAATLLAQKLNDLVDSVDWAGVGRKIGYYLNGALTFLSTFLKEFDWKGLGSDFATLLNNVITSVDWGNLGTLLVSKWLILLQFLTGFFETFDGRAFSKAVYDLIMGMVNACDWVGLSGELARNLSRVISEIDFGKIAAALSTAFRTVLQSLDALITNFDWHNLGVKLAGFLNGVDWNGIITDAAKLIGDAFTNFVNLLNGFIENADFGKIAAALSNGVKTLLDSLIKGVSDFKWNELGEKIADFLNNIDFGGIFSKLVKLLGGLLIGALNLLGSFLGDVDWGKLADDVWTALESLFKDINWIDLGDSVGKLLSNTLIGVLDFAVSLITDHDWGTAIQDGFGKIGEFIGSVIENIKWGEILGKLTTAVVGLILQIPGIIIGRIGGTFDYLAALFEAVGLDSVAGFFKGIGDAMREAGTWLKENVVDPVINWVKNLFGIHSPSTVFAEIGGYLIDGLLQGIKNVWGSITSFFTGAVEGVKNLLSGAWERISSVTSGAWEKVKNGLSSTWNGIKDKASGTWDKLKTTVSSGWENAKTNTSQTWDKIKATLSGTWTTLKSDASTSWNNLKTTISNGWNSVKTSTSKVWGEISSALSSQWTTLKSNASTAWNNLKTTVSGGWNDIKTSTASTWGAINSSVSSIWNVLKSNASTAWSGLKTTISNGWNGIKNDTSSIWGGIQSTLSGAWNVIKSTAASTWSGIKSVIENQGWANIGSNICNGIKNGLDAGWRWLKDTVSNLAGGLLSAAKSALGIQSPSKVFRDEVGLNIGYGIGEGVEDSEPSVLKSVTGIADAIAEEMNAGDYTISEIVPVSTVNGAIIDFTDKLTEGFVSAMDRLQTIADSVTFSIPTVAAGGMVPYKLTSTPDVPDNDNAMVSSAIEASNDELASVVTQVVMNAASSIVTAIQNNGGRYAGLDRAQTADAVIQEINRRTRMYNRSPLLS